MKTFDKNPTEKSPADENPTDKKDTIAKFKQRTRILLFQFFCVKKYGVATLFTNISFNVALK